MMMQILGVATEQLKNDCGATHTILTIEFREYEGCWRINSVYRAFSVNDIVGTTGDMDIDFPKKDLAKALSNYHDAVNAAMMDATMNITKCNVPTGEPKFPITHPLGGRLRN
jgi:hypothetical protein